MTILIRNACIKDKSSPHHDKVRDVFISDGKIVDIAEQINTPADTIIESKGLHLSPGWVDIFVSGTDPGFEFKDDLTSIAASAAAGGYTHVFLTPNTNPVTHNKTGVQYITEKKISDPVQLHPIGAVTKNTDGKELTEMFDMKQHGAVAFSDGHRSVQSAGLLIKALQYVKAFDGISFRYQTINLLLHMALCTRE
jgi:dihydroorotase